VVAGTAGAIHHRQEQKYANQAAEQQAQYEAQQAAQAPIPQAPPDASAAGGIDMEQLKQLGELHTAGVLSDEEFAAAKAKLLANI
jgi:hypothetical protein